MCYNRMVFSVSPIVKPLNVYAVVSLASCGYIKCTISSKYIVSVMVSSFVS